MPPRVVLLLGKKPRPGTIVAEASQLLAARGLSCEVRLPHEERVDAADLRGADLVVHRGLSPEAAPLLGALAADGTALCNPWAGMLHLRDRAVLHAALVRLQVPVSGAVVVPTWPDALAQARLRPVVVKAVSGPGRGRGVVTFPLPDDPPTPGPYLVEDRVEHDGLDRKLYVAGDVVVKLLKPSTLTAGHRTDGTPVTVEPGLAALARSTAAGLGLHLLGVDVVMGPDGPVVVDVNTFPGYRGVPGAARAVAEHVAAHASR